MALSSSHDTRLDLDLPSFFASLSKAGSRSFGMLTFSCTVLPGRFGILASPCDKKVVVKIIYCKFF